jgi:hypothetical protein
LEWVDIYTSLLYSEVMNEQTLEKVIKRTVRPMLDKALDTKLDAKVPGIVERTVRPMLDKALDTKLDAKVPEIVKRTVKPMLDEQDRGNKVMHEETHAILRQVAEYTCGLDEEIVRTRTEIKREIRRIDTGYTPIGMHHALDKRVTKLEKTR